MDIKKILSLVISGFLRNVDGTAKPRELLLGVYGDKVAVIDRSIRLFLIDKKYFPFKLDIVGDLIPVERIIPKEYDYESAVISDNMKKHDKTVAVEIKGSNGSAWIDSKLLTEYGKGISVKISTQKPSISSVLIYGGEDLIGLVLPLRMKEN